MTMGVTRSVAACVGIAVAAAGCTNGNCKDGTFRKGNTCYPYNPFDHSPPVITVTPPVRTRFVGTVTLTSNKPATIYYTTDGSTPTTSSPSHADVVVIPDQPDTAIVSFFAIDVAGNQSQVQTVSWIIDRIGPGVVQGFAVALAADGATRTVTWTPPLEPHPGGVIVARVDGALTASPTPGLTYAVGDVLSPGTTIVAVSAPGATATQTFTESRAAPPGLVRYVGWGLDDLANYGPATGAYTLVPLPVQTGTVHVTGAGTVAVTAPPANLALSGTASLAGTTLTVQLAVQNPTNRPLFAPKVLLTTAPAGVAWSNSDGKFMGSPYRAYGAMIPPGGTASAVWTFTGATAATAIDLALDIRDNKILFGAGAPFSATPSGGDAVDALAGHCSTTTTQGCSTSTDCSGMQTCAFSAIKTLHAGPVGLSGRSGMRGGGITPDGFVVLGSRNSGRITAFDLASGEQVGHDELLPQKANVPWVVLDASGSSGYALVGVGHPFSGRSGTSTSLVRFDAGSLAETGRLPIGTSRNHGLEISPDGATLLVVTGLTDEGVLQIDLATFQITRSLATSLRATTAAFSPDGSTIDVMAFDGLHRYARTTGAEQPLVPANPGGKAFRGDFTADGKLWVGRQNDLMIVDLAAGTTQIVANNPAGILEVFDGKAYIARERGNTVTRLANDGSTVEATFTFPDNIAGHQLMRSPF